MTVHNVALVGAGRMGGAPRAQCRVAARGFDLVAIADHERRIGRSSLADETGRDGRELRRDTGRSGHRGRHCRKLDQLAPRECPAGRRRRQGGVLRKAAFAGCRYAGGGAARDRSARRSRSSSRSTAASIRTSRAEAPLRRRATSAALETLHIINHDPATARPRSSFRAAAACSRISPSTTSTRRAWLLDEEFVELFAAGACLIDPEIGALGDIDTAKLDPEERKRRALRDQQQPADRLRL